MEVCRGAEVGTRLGSDRRVLLTHQYCRAKRACMSSPHKQGGSQTKLNRVRRRVVLRDYGKSIHKASSRVAMLTALEGYITGKKCKQRMVVLRTNKDRV
jgi:Fungal protein kinase